jgi:hypothetical protein
MIAAVAIVWFSLLIRKALLLVGVVLAPIAFAGASWDATKGWIGKWAAFVIALIISKLVLVVIFLLAITQIATPIELDIAAVTEPITGIVLMGIAAFAPYMVYRFVSFVGFDLYQQMGTEQEAKNALNRPVPIPSKPQGGGEPKKVLDDPKGGGEPGGGSGGTPPPRSPTPAPAPAAAGGGSAAGGGAAAGAGAGAAAGPLAAVVVGAKVAKNAAEAGPKAGHAVAGQAETAADAASGENGGTPPPSQTPPPSTPQPRTPTEPSNPTASPRGKE